jgi:hypothetical protein
MSIIPMRLKDWKQPATAKLRPDAMNKLEARYAEQLEYQRVMGLLQWWKFQPLKFKLKLADKTYYTPDFLVIAADGALEVHETKGFMQDDAAVKLKVAAETFPFRFKLVTLLKGKWEVKDV